MRQPHSRPSGRKPGPRRVSTSRGPPCGPPCGPAALARAPLTARRVLGRLPGRRGDLLQEPGRASSSWSGEGGQRRRWRPEPPAPSPLTRALSLPAAEQSREAALGARARFRAQWDSFAVRVVALRPGAPSEPGAARGQAAEHSRRPPRPAPRPPAAPGSARRRGRARGSAGCSARPGRRRGRGPPGGASHRTAGTGLELDGAAPEPPPTTHTTPPASGLTDGRGGFLFRRIEQFWGPQLSVSSSCGTRAGVTQGLLARAPGALRRRGFLDVDQDWSGRWCFCCPDPGCALIIVRSCKAPAFRCGAGAST